MVHACNGILLSLTKNEGMPLVAVWMPPESIRLSEVSQKEKDQYRMIALICGI